MKVHGLVAAVFVALGAGHAQALTLDCALSPPTDSLGIITERYFFDVDEANGKAVAGDALIQAYHEKPINVRLADNTAKKLVMTWTVQMTNNAGQQTKMQFRASIFKPGLAITVRAVPGGGYSNSFEGRGTCTPV